MTDLKERTRAKAVGELTRCISCHGEAHAREVALGMLVAAASTLCTLMGRREAYNVLQIVADSAGTNLLNDLNRDGCGND